MYTEEAGDDPEDATQPAAQIPSAAATTAAPRNPEPRQPGRAGRGPRDRRVRRSLNMPNMLHANGRAVVILAVRIALVCGFLLMVGRHHHAGVGFTELLILPEDGHADETPALQAVPHFHHPRTNAYDGQFYAQLALDPLLKDPLVERALDNPQYRARRILFSWTAWLMGLGRPAWIVQAYALQNVLVWLLLAWWLARRYPADDWRGLAVWIAVMFTHGLLASVRMAVLDGPSLLVIALAVTLSERGRPIGSALLVGIGGLGRETNLLAAVALGGTLSKPRHPWLTLVAGGFLVLAPFVLWLDYLRSVFGTVAFTSGGAVTWPFAVFADQWRGVAQVGMRGLPRHFGHVAALLSLTVQAVYVVARAAPRNPWWRLGTAYAALMLSVASPVWEGDPGAATRAILPLTLAFNLLLPSTRSFWPWLLAGNLTTLLAWRTLA